MFLSEIEAAAPLMSLIALIESHHVRCVPTQHSVTGIEPISDWILDETTILTGRHPMEKHRVRAQHAGAQPTLFACQSDRMLQKKRSTSTDSALEKL
jgi:hypothetical protein